MAKSKESRLVRWFVYTVVLMPWCAICFYPGIWHLTQSEEQTRRMSKWGRMTRQDLAAQPVSDLLHRLRFPNHNAVIKNRPERINWNDHSHPEIDYLDSHGHSMLSYAVFFKDEKFTGGLLKRGANPNLQSPRGETPLLLAAKEKYEEIAAILLDFNARADIPDQKGETALHYAARLNCRAILSRLDKEKMDLNIKDKRGLTPLDWAAIRNHLPAVMDLCIAGAEPKTLARKTTVMVQSYLELVKETKDAQAAAQIFAERDEKGIFNLLNNRVPAELPISSGHAPSQD